MLSPQTLFDTLHPYLKYISFEKGIEVCHSIHANFVRFTRMYIARVNTLASFVENGMYYPNHDADKFDSPFYYLLQYRHSGNKIEDIVKDIDEVNKLIGAATLKHIVTKPHHPEFWDKKLSVNSPFDRNSPTMNIDAREMPYEALTEYVCDCLSMSIQIHKNPHNVFQWFAKNIGTGQGKRWIMKEEQLSFINSLATSIIKKLEDKNRAVYFDVDGVLRDIVGYFGTPDNDWDVKIDGKTIYEMLSEDFSCLEKMQATVFMPVVQKFTQSPYILSTQIEPEAQVATTKWLLKYFDDLKPVYVGEGSSQEKDSYVGELSRIFDDHPKFPSSPRLIILGHGYNVEKYGFRVNTADEMEAALEVLKPW